MRKTTKGKGLAGGTAVAAVVAGLALLHLGWLRCGGRCQPPLPCWLWPVWRLS